MRRNIQLRISTTCILTVAFCLALAVNQVSAGPKGPKGGQGDQKSLPPLPSSAAINNVISSSHGPQFTPFGVPSSILGSFSAFQSPFSGLQNSIDTQQSVAYINEGGLLLQMAMPLQNAASTALTPNITTPDDGSPARVIGGLWESSMGDNIVVVIFSGDNKIKQIRLYHYNVGSLTYT